MRADGSGAQWRSRAGVHMDCLHWVNRDSYLPQGSRGLKVGGGEDRHSCIIETGVGRGGGADGGG